MANNTTNKRLLQESENDERPGARRMRRDTPSSTSVMLEALSGTRMEEALSSALETLCQRVVQEELERAILCCMGSLHKSPSSSTLHIGKAKSSSTSMQLVFDESLPRKMYTKVNLVDRQLGIKLVDVATGQIVPLKTLVKVEIVVLHGDFPSSNNGDDWTSEEFNMNVVKQREGKRPLLVGDHTVVVLREGKATIDGELEFTDNSSWTRSSTFRLGARVVPGSYAGERINEAISKKPFKVLDRRGEAYKKHYPPHLHDEVWRLEKIGKDGSFHKKLETEGITTVQDFLGLLTVCPRYLQSIVGQGSEHKWLKTINHAKTCDIGPELFMYHGKNFSVILDNIFQVRGIKYSDHILRSGELTSQQLDEAMRLAVEAYKNKSHLQEMSPTERVPAVFSTKTGCDQLPEPAGSNIYKQSFVAIPSSLDGLVPEAEISFGNDMRLAYSSYHTPADGIFQSLYNLDNND